MTTKTRLNLAVLGLFVCLYLVTLGFRPLMEPDETRYGEISREMIVSGDWITPRLDGLRYFEKPSLGYWLNGASMLAFGENGFAIRLPSALSVGLSALLIMLLIRRSCPRDEVWAGPVAALIFLTSLEVAAVGTFSVLDSMLAATLTLTIVCLFLASREERGSADQRRLLIAAGVSCGLAFLIKGFLALVVPALAMGAYLAWERRWRDILGLAWLPLIAATLTALPWSLAIHAREPDFWNFFFWHEHVQRFMGGNKAQHKESLWFFFLAAPAMFLPWTFLIPAALPGLKNKVLPTVLSAKGERSNPDEGTRQLVRFCLAWFCLPFLFFSLSSGKLLTYILPCFPPFAILLGLGLLTQLRTGRDRLFRTGAKAAALVFGLGAIAFFVIQVIGVAGVDPPYTVTWQWLLGLSSLLAMTVLPLAVLLIRQPGAKIILFGLSMTVLLCSAPFIIPDQVITQKSPGVFLLRHQQEITADTVVLSDEDPLRAVCWFLKRADVLLVNGAGEASYGLGYADARGRLLDLAQTRAKILANPGKTVLIARSNNYHKWAPELPPPKAMDDSGRDGYVFARY
jgi:4-amino-4-deoxy-L-arabinose transferase